MLRWIAYIKSLHVEILHITGKHNVVANMLSRERYESEENSRSDEFYLYLIPVIVKIQLRFGNYHHPSYHDLW